MVELGIWPRSNLAKCELAIREEIERRNYSNTFLFAIMAKAKSAGAKIMNNNDSKNADKRGRVNFKMQESIEEQKSLSYKLEVSKIPICNSIKNYRLDYLDM